MQDSGIILKGIFVSSVSLIWLLTISGGNTYASETEASSGFCDCTIIESASSDVICHIPPGNHQNMHTISVGTPAIHAHLNHGDMLGACPGDDEAAQQESESENEQANGQTYASCTCADGTTGNLYHAPDATVPTQAFSQRSVFGQ